MLKLIIFFKILILKLLFFYLNFYNRIITKEPDRQRICIHIKDVNDENPYFINRPLPMQAAVQLNAQPGTPVFKLQARDPDTDHNIHYFLVRDRSKYIFNTYLRYFLKSFL